MHRLRPYFLEPSNVDVLAFHEAFSDIVALFQRFSYRELLAEHIQASEGELQKSKMLAELAQQFGQAPEPGSGTHAPLPSALRRTRSPPHAPVSRRGGSAGAAQASGASPGCRHHKPTGPTLEILKAFALARFFDAVVCGDTLLKRKPDPAPLLVAAARLEIAPAETIVVGDNYPVVAAARAAAMRVMIVTWGYLRGCSEKLEGDCILQGFADVPQAIAALGR